MSISDALKTTSFVPAVVKDMPSMGLIIEYYVYDPLLDCSVRKRMRVGRLVKHVKGKNQRLAAANRIAEEINRKLSGGWSPLQQQSDGRLYTPLKDFCYRWTQGKAGEGARATTVRQYRSEAKKLLEWCEANGLGHKVSSTFVHADAVRYMDYVLGLDNRHCSYNNTVKALKALFQWGIEHCYVRENPFMGIKMLRRQEKMRNLVDEDDMAEIYHWFARHQPAMNVVCGLVYASAVRPIEATRIRVRDVDLAEKVVRISAENAKNHHQRFATLSPHTAELLERHIMGASGDDYVFGANIMMRPGAVPKGEQSFQKCWARMREELMLPMSVKLYSLRDTGFVDLIHSGVDQLTVQQHADHSSLAMQDIYTRHADPHLRDKIYGSGVDFDGE